MRWRRGWILSALLISTIVTSGAPLTDPAPRDFGPQVRNVQVIAHPDDDILFMNPDLAAGIHNGQPSVSIYLTGGESSLPNRAEYAAQRQEGTRVSYARMAGVPNEWNRTAVSVKQRLVEVDELRARRDVKLVFLNVPEDNNPQQHTLIRLWENPSAVAPSLVTASGAVRQSYAYRHSDIIEVLAGLFELFRPSSIRLQDPQPDPRYQTEWNGFHNHPDHVMAAHFGRAAAERYMANPRRGAPLVHYRDYNVADAPVNLPAADRRSKRDYFSSYAERDSEAAYAGAYVDWADRTYYRWPRGNSWAARDDSGRVHAFAVYGTRLQHWTRATDGQWSTPRSTPVPEPLRPAVTLLPDAHGKLVLLAQSLDGQRILLRRQQPSGAWTPGFTSIDAPPGQQIGTPAAVVDTRGRLLVATQVVNGGVCVRAVEAEQQWHCLGDQDVQDGVAAVLGPDQRVHLFASTRNAVLHWQQQEGGTFALVNRNLGGIRPAGRPQAVRGASGVEVIVRTAGEGAVARIAATGDRPPRILRSPGGFAPPVVTDRDPVRVFARDSTESVQVAREDGTWSDLGGQVLDHPAALVEPNGLVTLIAQGVDGRLLVNPQLPHATVATFGGWRAPMPTSDPTQCQQRKGCG